MDQPDSTPRPLPFSPARWTVFLLIFGLYLTLRGYHSRDGDQAYRLPLLLHRQNPALFADDPFVRAFDVFNPHRGYLVLLDLASRPLGLSAGMFALFALTFAATCLGLDRLSRAAWPECSAGVGVVAIGLALTAKAGNIGTNHLFEAMLLDRLIGFALGWLALGWVVDRPERYGGRAAVAIGLSALVHPSVGLQMAMLLGASWAAWAFASRATGVDVRRAALGLAALGLALLPGVALQTGQGGRLFEGLAPEDFRLLSVELQGPQHMLPHLWRMPQWLAFGCYLVLAWLALGTAGRPENDGPGRMPAARMRLVLLLVVNLAGLGLAWVAIEVVRDLRMTVFQPFRMATLFRGLALVAHSGRLVGLWRAGRLVDRSRAVLLAVGLAGDWMLVVATAIDIGVATIEAAAARRVVRNSPWALNAAFGVVLVTGLAFLARHDTESGHIPLLSALAVLAVASVFVLVRGGTPVWSPRRLAWSLAAAWALPLAAFLAAAGSNPTKAWAVPLVNRCRFGADPADDVERLAVWCRAHTPLEARFIGPPGPKTFRLWSLRSLAFNRAASPYHASGLADWAERFRDHVGLEGPAAELVQAYRDDRHGLEQRYQAMGDARRAALARRQGAGYVVAAPPDERADAKDDGPLELLHVEGRYAVYRVRVPGSMTARPTTLAPDRPPGVDARVGPAFVESPRVESTSARSRAIR